MFAGAGSAVLERASSTWTLHGAFAALSVALVMLLPVGVARAHPRIDAARTRYENADFAGALRALTAAEHAHDLTRADVLDLLHLRALLHLATSEPAALDADVLRILSLAPDEPFDPASPPELLEAVARARAAGVQPLGIETRVEPGEGVLVLLAEAVHDTGGLVSEVRVQHLAADGTWTTAAPAPVEISLPTSGRLAYSAVALGLGGAVLVRAGSPEAPLQWPPAEVQSGGDVGGGGSTWLWVGLGAAAVVVAVAIVVTVTVMSNAESDTTRPGLPVLVRF